MKVKTLSVLAGLGGSLLLGGAANAAYTGLTAESKDAVVAGNFVCNVYANFDNPNDVMVAVAGTPGTPMNISTDGTFYQNAFGGDQAPNPALFAVFPSLADDTFVTIGKKTSIGDQTGLTPGWPGFGASSLSGTNLGWFITPDQAQGAPVDGKVLIGQFTTDGSVVSGSFLIQAVSDGNQNFQAVAEFTHAIPAPGALALLGLAGIAGRRRRG